MMTLKSLTALIILIVLSLAVPALAHHAFSAEFDYDKPITITGVLVKVDWINPHTYHYVEAKDEKGNTLTWAIESAPPGLLRRVGVTRDMFKIGMQVSIDGWAGRDSAKHLMFAKTFRFADGRTIHTRTDNLND